MNPNVPNDAGGDTAANPPAAGAAHDAALEAKRKTVEELKTFEAGKAQANASLAAKLADFTASLSNQEQGELGLLLNLGTGAAGRQPAGPENAFLKPMQRTATSAIPQRAMQRIDGAMEVSIFVKPIQYPDGGTEVSIFLKPVQRTENLADQAVFLKPMQRTAEAMDETAFLKPMQRGTDPMDEAAFLKPMQRTADPMGETAFLKPMQRMTDTTDQTAFLKPMQRATDPTDETAFLKPMQRTTE